MSLFYNNLMGALGCHEKLGWGRKPIQTKEPFALGAKISDLPDRRYFLSLVPCFVQLALEFASTAIAFRESLDSQGNSFD
jgi:hypothetical protein